MRRALVASGWIGAAAVVAGAAALARLPWLDGARTPDEAAQSHLARQSATNVLLSVALDEEPLALRGRLEAQVTLADRDTPLRLVAARDVALLRVRFGDAELHEPERDATWIARPGALRELRGALASSGPLVVEFLLPLHREEGPLLWRGAFESLIRVDGAAATRLVAAPASRAGGDGVAEIVDPLAPVERADPPARYAPPFALAPDGERLAIAVERDRAGDDGVLVVFARGGAAASEARWFALTSPARGLAWSAHGDALAIASDDGVTRLASTRDGTVEPLDGSLQFAEQGDVALESIRRAPGCSLHRLRELGRGGIRSLPAAGRGAVRFAAGRSLLLRADADGAAGAIAADGRAVAQLPFAFAAGREVRTLPLGWCAVIDRAAGSRLLLLRPGGELERSLDFAAAIRAVRSTADGAALLVFGEKRDEKGAALRIVERLALGSDASPEAIFRGRERPLPQPAAGAGLLLADERARDRDGGVALLFASFAALGAPRAPAPRRVAEGALLAPPPALSADGRYLYFRRARDGELRRVDLLAGREEPLVAAPP